MKIEYFHASKFGNGAAVAQEFKTCMGERGVSVDVHHVRDARPREVPAADLYVFSSPGRMGRPIGRMRRFLRQLKLPAGIRYALLVTEGAPQPDANGKMPAPQELARWQRVIPIMNEVLQARGYVNVAEEKVQVTGMKGPLEPDWKGKVHAFAGRMPTS